MMDVVNFRCSAQFPRRMNALAPHLEARDASVVRDVATARDGVAREDGSIDAIDAARARARRRGR